MIVVAVLITNCHVSLKLNNGPVISQTKIVPTASENTIGRPQNRELPFANREYHALCAILPAPLSMCS